MSDTNPIPGLAPPSSRKLIRSTVVAVIVAATLLVTVVMPAEYGIDPTGVGGLLGLRSMGEIKVSLGEEVATLARVEQAATTPQRPQPERVAVPAPAVVATQAVGPAPSVPTQPTPPSATSPVSASPAAASPAVPAPHVAATVVPTAPVQAAQSSHVTEVVLAPNEGKEIKLVMRQGARVSYSWSTDDGVVNYDLHADAPGIDYHGYVKGSRKQSDEGILVAAFDGSHGWYWRNRGSKSVTVTLTTTGDYEALKRL